MMKKVDVTKKRFGKLTARRYTGYRSGSSVVWLCKCDCGNYVFVSVDNLRNGVTKSCGCLQKEKVSTHGLYKTLEYNSWINMKQRCSNKEHGDYKNYGGRGIKVCERWKNSFSNFIEDMGKRPYPELSIDRINNGGNYEWTNCRWATRKEQANNKRRYVTRGL